MAAAEFDFINDFDCLGSMSLNLFIVRCHISRLWPLVNEVDAGNQIKSYFALKQWLELPNNNVCRSTWRKAKNIIESYRSENFISLFEAMSMFEDKTPQVVNMFFSNDVYSIHDPFQPFVWTSS